MQKDSRPKAAPLWNFGVFSDFLRLRRRKDSVSVREPSQRRPEAGSLQVFVLDIDHRPTLAFEAPDHEQAREICRDADLRADLVTLTSDGAPICAPNSTLVPRAAAPEEIAAFQHAVGQAPASDQPTMAFLVKIDGIMVVSVGPDQA